MPTPRIRIRVRIRTTRAIVVTVATALLVVVAAPSAVFAAPSAGSGDATTVTVAGMASLAQFPSGDIGAQARFKRFNDTQEIAGVTIESVGYVDDKQDPATAQAAARQLVKQNKVLAVVPNLSEVTPGGYLTDRHVPWFGPGLDASYCAQKASTSLYGFAPYGCLVPADPTRVPDSGTEFYQYVSQKTGKPKPTLAVVSTSSERGKQIVGLAASSYSGAGFDIVYAKGSLASPIGDASPYAEALLTADEGKNPDAIACLVAADCVSIWQLLKANNYAGSFSSPASLYSELPSRPLTGSVVEVPFVPFAAATPAMKQLVDDVHAYKADAIVDATAVSSYLSADMFIAVLQQLKKKNTDITSANVQKAAITSTFKVKDLYGPTKYPASNALPTPSCHALVLGTGTAWETVMPLACSKKTFEVQPEFRTNA